MRILTKPQIEKCLKVPDVFPDILDAIRSAFIQFDRGTAQIAPVIHLNFKPVSGECHVKSGHLEGDEVFVIKVATGFYKNPALGLSSSNGCLLIMSAVTGEPLALLQDEGHLTDTRTALAGVLSVEACARADAQNLGIMGSGIQAELHAFHLLSQRSFTHARFWARSPDKLTPIIDRLQICFPTVQISISSKASDLCACSDVIVATTASTSPIIESAWIQPGTHITAVGADSPGKQELDTGLFLRADAVVADAVSQCVAHGEIANAIETGVLSQEQLLSLGSVLAKGGLKRAAADITVADLTGVAVQDIAIAKCVWANAKRMNAAEPGNMNGNG